MPTDKVIFPKGKTWEDYVDSRRMEITCGEAPFVVNRYDVETGEAIPIKNRFGFLDRKLRVVNENAAAEDEWLTWAIRAFQATYAYEFQGDNLLISRVNLLMTFEEYLQDRWNRKPSIEEYRKIANIIVWNIWQMDGLTGTVPYSKVAEQFEQVSLFDLIDFGEEKQEEKETNPPCRIYDWRANKSLELNSLKRARN